MIAVIDMGCNNMGSLMAALHRLNVPTEATTDIRRIQKADKVILPGVGSAGCGMKQLIQLKLHTIIPNLSQPVLGICMGMHLMCQYSTEDGVECMNIFPVEINKLPASSAIRVPHMGWNQIDSLLTNPLLTGIDRFEYFYFVHSFAAEINPYTFAQTTHGHSFSAGLRRNNFYATQFHPERSAQVGSRLLNNFLNL